MAAVLALPVSAPYRCAAVLSPPVAVAMLGATAPSQRTARAYSAVATAMFAGLSDVAAFDAAAAAAYVASLAGLAPSTRAVRLRVARRMAERLVAMGALPNNPLRGLAIRRTRRARVPPLRAGDGAALLTAVTDHPATRRCSPSY